MNGRVTIRVRCTYVVDDRSFVGPTPFDWGVAPSFSLESCQACDTVRNRERSLLKEES